MQIEKQEVVGMLRAQGEHDKAQSAACALPRHVDTDRDAGLLHVFGINTSDITRETEDGAQQTPIP